MSWYDPRDWFGNDMEGKYLSDFGIPNNYGLGGQRFGGRGGMDPLSLGNSIGLVAAGRHSPTDVYAAEDEDAPGPFSQLGSAIGGLPGKVGGALKSGMGKVGEFVGWDDMKGMDKAWLLSQAIGAGADIYGAHKQGKLEDEERDRRQRSAEALRPYMMSLMDRYGG
jgi:hypothetical protein